MLLFFRFFDTMYIIVEKGTKEERYGRKRGKWRKKRKKGCEND